MRKKRLFLTIMGSGFLLIAVALLFIGIISGDRKRTVDKEALEAIITRMEEEHRQFLGPSGLEEYSAFFEFDSDGYGYFAPAGMSPFPKDDYHIKKLENFGTIMQERYSRLESLVDDFYFYHHWEHFLEPAIPNYMSVNNFLRDARRDMLRLAASGYTEKAADSMILQIRFFERCMYYPIQFYLVGIQGRQLIASLPVIMRYPGMEKEVNRIEEALENLAQSLHDTSRKAVFHREAFYYVAGTPEMLNAPQGNYFSLFGEDGTIGFYSSLMFLLVRYQRREPEWLEDIENRRWLEKQSEKLEEWEESTNVRQFYPPLLNPFFFANFRSRIRDMVENEPFFQQDFPGLPRSYHETLSPELRIHVLIWPQTGLLQDNEVPFKAKIDIGRMFLKTCRFLSEEESLPLSIDKLFEKDPLQAPLLLHRKDYQIRYFHENDRKKGAPVLKQWITSQLSPHSIQSTIEEKNDMQMFFTIREVQHWHIGRSWQGFLQELEPIVQGTGEKNQWVIEFSGENVPEVKDLDGWVPPEEDIDAAFSNWLSDNAWENPFPAKIYLTPQDDFDWRVLYSENLKLEKHWEDEYPVIKSSVMMPLDLPVK